MVRLTEKRFTELISSIDYYTIWDNKEDKGLTVEDAVDLLNELDEKYVDEFSLRETLQQELQRVENENKELKKILKFLRNDNATDILNVLNTQENQIWKLKKENEQLKKIRDIAFELAEEPTQHTLWKVRTFLKEYNSER